MTSSLWSIYSIGQFKQTYLLLKWLSNGKKNISLNASPAQRRGSWLRVKKNFFTLLMVISAWGNKSKLFLSQIFFWPCPFTVVKKKTKTQKKKIKKKKKKKKKDFTILTVISEILTLNSEFWELKSEKKPALWKNNFFFFLQTSLFATVKKMELKSAKKC